MQARVEKLEAQPTAGTVTHALGGMAVVKETPDGKFSLPDGLVLDEDELDALLVGTTGRLLILPFY
jgi:hypothetical protein